MAGTVFDITPEELEQSAKKIETHGAAFSKAHTDIYVATAGLRATYKGQASEAFNKRIEGYKNDFQAMEKTLKSYVQFLREYAAKMKATENELVGRAGQLSVGQ